MSEKQDYGFQFVKQLNHDLEKGNLKLPTFPEVALRVRRVINDPHSDVEKVLNVVKTDPALTARLLKMANSALMRRGVDGPVDLRSTISRLGFDMVKNAAMAVALQQIMTARSMGAMSNFLNPLWLHSIQVAVLSYIIAKQTKVVMSDHAMLAGLMHDIGKYYIYMRADEHSELTNNPEHLHRVVDLWHGEIGAEIMEAWGFEKAYIEVSQQHNNYKRKHNGDADIVDVVMLANLHANIGKDGYPKEWSNIDALSKLNLTPESSISLIRESRVEIKEIIASLQ